MTAMHTAMIALHEMYLSARKAGFTEPQAMQLITAIAAASQGNKND